MESKRTDMRGKSSSPTDAAISVEKYFENLDQTGGAEGMGVQLEDGDEGKSLLQIHSQTNTQSPTLT